MHQEIKDLLGDIGESHGDNATLRFHERLTFSRAHFDVAKAIAAEKWPMMTLLWAPAVN